MWEKTGIQMVILIFHLANWSPSLLSGALSLLAPQSFALKLAGSIVREREADLSSGAAKPSGKTNPEWSRAPRQLQEELLQTSGQLSQGMWSRSQALAIAGLQTWCQLRVLGTSLCTPTWTCCRALGVQDLESRRRDPGKTRASGSRQSPAQCKPSWQPF